MIEGRGSSAGEETRGDIMRQNPKKWVIVAALIFLAVVRIPRIINHFTQSEVREYLSEMYPGTKFRIKNSEIVTKEPFEVRFQVKKYKDHIFYDDYRQQLVKIIANQSGLPCEVVTYADYTFRYGAKVIVYYPDYASIEGAVNNFEQLIQECRKYEILKSRGPRLTISAGNVGEPYFPGYEIRIAEPQPGEEDQTEDLVRQIKNNYIYTIHNFSIIEDDSIPEADITGYYKYYPGTVVQTPKGSREYFPLVHMRGDTWGLGAPFLDFGGAYQILKGQGAEIVAEHNKFTATLNEKTITFYCDFSDGIPKYSWEYPDNQYKNRKGSNSIGIELIEEFIGKRIGKIGEAI